MTEFELLLWLALLRQGKGRSPVNAFAMLFSCLPESTSLSDCKYWPAHSKGTTVFCSVRRQAKLNFLFMSYLSVVFLISMLGSMCYTVDFEETPGEVWHWHCSSWAQVDPKTMERGWWQRVFPIVVHEAHRQAPLSFLVKCMCCNALQCCLQPQCYTMECMRASGSAA